MINRRFDVLLNGIERFLISVRSHSDDAQSLENVVVAARRSSSSLSASVFFDTQRGEVAGDSTLQMPRGEGILHTFGFCLCIPLLFPRRFVFIAGDNDANTIVFLLVWVGTCYFEARARLRGFLFFGVDSMSLDPRSNVKTMLCEQEKEGRGMTHAGKTMASLF